MANPHPQDSPPTGMIVMIGRSVDASSPGFARPVAVNVAHSLFAPGPKATKRVERADATIVPLRSTSTASTRWCPG